MRRTKATLIYKHRKNVRAVKLSLGHSKLQSTVRYLGVEVDDARKIAEQTEIQIMLGGCTSHVRPLSGIILYECYRPSPIVQRPREVGINESDTGPQRHSG